uniref:Uncharacterized protein n=1 Tax=Bubo bubo TaxID=30461 RepID=A0A8C0IGV5_BUBBB
MGPCRCPPSPQNSPGMGPCHRPPLSVITPERVKAGCPRPAWAKGTGQQASPYMQSVATTRYPEGQWQRRPRPAPVPSRCLDKGVLRQGACSLPQAPQSCLCGA